MIKQKNILMVSNGHGEDLIAANLVKEVLKKAKKEQINIGVLPIVGKGDHFQNLPVDIIGPQNELPSGGFARNSFINLLKDLRAGLLSSIYKQIKTLKKSKNKYDLSVVVGDVYILLLTGFFKGGNIIFLPTAKSEYINSHYTVEKQIMKKYADIVLPRDQKTKEDLVKHGVKADFFGNLMMDCFDIKKLDFNLEKNSIKIGILPGSRKEVYQNMMDFINVIEKLERLKKVKYEFLTAVTGNFSVNKFRKKLLTLNWKVIKSANEHVRLKMQSKNGYSNVNIIYNGFGDVLDQAKLFMGMAGTANEQAAGMGKPVIIFPGTGAQFDYEFAADQKRLLGEGVKFVERNFKNVAYSIIELLEDDNEYQKRSEAGKKRMGDRGAIKKVSKLLYDSYLKSK